MIRQYRPRHPRLIEAVFWDGTSATWLEIAGWGERAIQWVNPSYLLVHTLCGTASAPQGSWIVRQGPGDFYVLNSDAFNATFELAFPNDEPA